jgi:protein-S-isoprenylcysteine O-methyltransferase Ste14
MLCRFLPLIGAILLLLITLLWRPWLQRRRHGTWGIQLFRAKSLGQRARDAAAVFLFFLLIGQAVLAATWPEHLPLPLPIDGIIAKLASVVGAALLFGGLLLLVMAQLDLGASWRIGIDEAAKPGPVTTGLYRFSRNPIFSALLAVVAGNALLVPTWLSISLLAGTYLEVRAQTFAEESYLEQTYGDTYRGYARRVGRFLPGIGRLT